MTVYITFEKDGYNGESVSGVFADKQAAEKDSQLGGHFARVEEHEVVGSFPSPLARVRQEVARRKDDQDARCQNFFEEELSVPVDAEARFDALKEVLAIIDREIGEATHEV